ncbi:F0F1 ATP synthase subunit A [Rhodothalassium salexigens]|uniref:ATP synthase subunit a n=1 Tax=Rhodothalassium salexigens DSM 2132 TaxID=1188247 RepID=A0A4R2PEE1_RHOSA|nr:F0F1 ATP synthase subunit A [Rhodothalassium salexigens]MBB4211919.1 F-type H+-transporting ATPase subunit a [Rhodothalassium salexigens DSM 2132]MBK1639273.1 F0F1 ATP synthase subunit A [Rhodothalassium salexigens DSM 2132]MBK5911358.1 F0F1 ATP synthase subunit A [Rhodothalassium salexigens]TCP33497.1 ATP synthase F0 subcomplex A subunit [Rhodothalassium salexigens DSM 2132]
MAGPLEQFEIHRIGAPLEVAGLDISFNNAAAYMIAVAGLLTAFVMLGTRRQALVPGRLQSMVEMSYEFVAGMVRDNIGSHGRSFFPFVFSLFMFVLTANVMGLLPYAFTVTSHLAVTFAFAICIFFAVVLIGLVRNGLSFFSLFMPSGTPWILAPLIVAIEVFSFLVRPVTLSVRLFANMTAGHILLKVFAGFIVSLGAGGGVMAALGVLPFAMIVAFQALELLVAVAHAYVFALLTCVYLKDAVDVAH